MSGSLVRFGVLVGVVALLAGSGGGLTVRAATTAGASSWSQLPMAARGPVAAAMASHDPRYRVSPTPTGLAARNPAQRLRLRFSPAGAGVSLGGDTLRFALQTIGRAATVQQLESVEPHASAPNRVVYRRPGLSEWYANTPLGLEQGFTVQRRPAGRGPLTLAIGSSGSLTAEASRHGQTIAFGPLVYRDLLVTDARGHTVPARLQLAGQRILIQVHDEAARYPIRVDPILQMGELTASDGAADDSLGFSVAISGDTIVAGAFGHTVGANASQGAVYVFAAPGGAWTDATQTAELTASDGAAGDELGLSVAIDGDMVVAGAPYHQVGSNSQQGTAYVFTKPVGGWTDATQTAKLTATDGDASDALGFSVAVSGDTIVAGAPYHQIGANLEQGTAYDFTKPVGGWANSTQTAELTASDGAAGDLLGSSVAVSGNTITAAALGRRVGGNDSQGAVYVFTKPVGGWTNATQTAELTASDGEAYDALGYSVAVSGGTIVAGAFGHTVGGNSYQGAAYVFTKPVGGWTNGTQTVELTATDGAAVDEFGISVAVSGDTIAAGAFGHTVGGSSNQGAVYVFTTASGGWTDAAQVAELTALHGAAGDELGSSVAIDTDTIAAGAPYHQVGGNVGQGAVYVFMNTIKVSPSISTVQQPATAAVGSSIADKATVSGGYNPTGTVTFKLYNNPNGTGSALFTDTKSLANGSATSGGYATTATGTHYWVATYNGDTNNNPVASGLADEPVTVTKASPSISTAQQPATGAIGSSIADKATLSGGSNPSGTVTFKLYDNANGTGSALFTDTKSLSNGTATSGSYATTALGTYYWIATYNGDGNNNAVTSGTSDEPVTVTKASPSISTTQQPASATVGSSIADSATVSGGYSPSGTVTFKLYNNANGTGSALFTDTKSLANGSATSASYATTATGTYYWIATYNGDTNNNTASSGVADEPVTVTKASPSISTVQQPASVTVGSSIADSATVSGGISPSGTVTFKLYNNTSGTGSALFTDTEQLSNGSATSAGYTTSAAGTVYWIATYNGDADNGTVSSGTADEPVAVTKASPSIATVQQPASAAVGSSIADKATVSGGYNPTGTVTFKLYDNPNGTGSALFTDTKSLANGNATSAGYATTATGTYYWVATYNGDANNTTASSGTADEPVTATKTSPSLSTTQLPASAQVGKTIADKATVSGGYQPSGTVTFSLYDNATGTGTPLFTDTEPVSNGSATSAAYPATALGTYYWVAAYTGDANNNAASSGTADEPVTVAKASPTISTKQRPASAKVGRKIADKATVTGGYKLSGKVTFRLYKNSKAHGKPVFTSTRSLSNGSAISASYKTKTTGKYYWVVTYSGNALNNRVASGKADERVTVHS